MAHRVAGGEVALEVEGVVDRGVGGNEALGLALGLEPLHFSFSSPDGKVGIFDPIVVAQSTGMMAMPATQDLHRCLV